MLLRYSRTLQLPVRRRLRHVAGLLGRPQHARRPLVALPESTCTIIPPPHLRPLVTPLPHHQPPVIGPFLCQDEVQGINYREGLHKIGLGAQGARNVCGRGRTRAERSAAQRRSAGRDSSGHLPTPKHCTRACRGLQRPAPQLVQAAPLFQTRAPGLACQPSPCASRPASWCSWWSRTALRQALGCWPCREAGYPGRHRRRPAGRR